MPSPDFPPRISVQSCAKAVAFNADDSRLYVVAEGDLSGFSRGGRPPITFEAVEGHRPQALAVSPTGGAVACAVGTGHLNSERTTLEIFSAAGERLRVIDFVRDSVESHSEADGSIPFSSTKRKTASRIGFSLRD